MTPNNNTFYYSTKAGTLTTHKVDMAAFPYKVCNVCFAEYGSTRAKIDSLLKWGCLERPDRDPHVSVEVRVRILNGILDPEIRPMPKVYFRGFFVDCNPQRCRGEVCTFSHCHQEKAAWNRQRTAASRTSSVTADPTSPSVRQELSGGAVTSEQFEREETWPDSAELDLNEGPISPRLTVNSIANLGTPITYTSPLHRYSHGATSGLVANSPPYTLTESRPVVPMMTPDRPNQMLLPSAHPQAPLEPMVKLPPTVIPLYPGHSLPLPLQPREAMPPITKPRQFGDHLRPTRTQQPSQPATADKKSILSQSLEVGNYHRKFHKLLELEETAHAELLKTKCDGKYPILLYQAGKTPEEVRFNVRSDLVRVGYIKEISSDQVSYATQSASSIDIEFGDHRVFCEILQENMYHAQERLYIGFKKEVVSMLPSKKGKNIYETSKVQVHFRLKFSYFRSLKESISNLQNETVSRILPESKGFLPTKEVETSIIAPLVQFCSHDQFDALKVIASAPPSGPPVLVAGPFGTGKTRVLALAAHYFLFESISKKKRLGMLLCTQQQTSADAYLDMYNNLTQDEEEITVVRLVPKHSTRMNKFTKSVDHFLREIERSSHRNSRRYLIITTCLTAKLLIGGVLPKWFFTHIFLDEGAQMREPEAIAPLCMASRNTKIVVAGDKFQVGPQMLVLGEEPQEHGLAVSLLERLYNLYHSQDLKEVAKPYCAHLSTNFRCHRGIINLARQVAYKAPLACQVHEHQNAPSPLHFVCTSLDMDVQQTKDSTCRTEVEAALREAAHYVKHWPADCWGERQLEKMCFLSPSRGQVSVARGKNIKNLPPQIKDVRKVPTYLIQGQEFRALFISTSEPTYPSSKTKDPTKSISDPSVFITAITRARSLVVAVGNPFMLLRREDHMVKKFGDRGYCWSLFLKACFDNNTISVYKDDTEDSALILEELRGIITRRVSHISKPKIVTFCDERRESVLSTSTDMPLVKTTPSASHLLTVEPPAAESPLLYVDILGEGGFGVVCCMQHRVDKKKYAVKIVRLHDRSEEEKKVMREVEALSQLDHLNIVRYYDSWKETAPPNWHQILPWKLLPSTSSDSRSYFSDTRHTGESENQIEAPEAPPVCLCIRTELCLKETLKTWLYDNKHNRTRKVITSWLKELLKGVAYIHQKGLIHRDLKPSNIFFSGAEPMIKIGDFGLVTTSQVSVGEVTSSQRSRYVGTGFYISPEQNNKEPYGNKIDIYALGITYFEMNYPFETDMERCKVVSALRNVKRIPKRFEKNYPHESKLIRQMLEEDPKDRPSAKILSDSQTIKNLAMRSKKSKAPIRAL